MFVYQERARCFGCCEVIEGEVVFAALCGHDTCPSTTWHYQHLMAARETQEEAERTGGNPGRAIMHLLDVLRR
jgi:hypothetical protein